MINIPANRKEVVDRMRADVQAELKTSNPFLRNSFLGAIIASMGGRNFEFYFQLQEAINDLFPLTATDEFADGWGALKGITRNPASQAEGNIVVTGTAGNIVPLGTEFSTPAGELYQVQISTTLVTLVQTITGLTSVGITATAITADVHNLATGMSVLIFGADQVEYNGVFVITVVDSTSFIYTISGSPVSPATGLTQLSVDTATVTVKSVAFGANQNQDAGTQLNITSPIAGVDNTAFVDINGLLGAVDLESDEDFRNRYLFVYQNPISQFNESAVIKQAKEVPGVTRVKVFKITPEVGAATILFTRDNDPNIIPNPAEVQTVKDKIFEILPINDSECNIFVRAPIPVTVDFKIKLLDQDSTTMRQSVTDNLEVYFREQTDFGDDLKETEYTCIVAGTVDEETGVILRDFEIVEPVGDIPVDPDELPVLGTVDYI